MISRSDWEPLPKPTLSPFARGYLSLCRFFTAAVWCVPALRVPLVHSLINHFRQNRHAALHTHKVCLLQQNVLYRVCTKYAPRPACICPLSTRRPAESGRGSLSDYYYATL